MINLHKIILTTCLGVVLSFFSTPNYAGSPLPVTLSKVEISVSGFEAIDYCFLREIGISEGIFTDYDWQKTKDQKEENKKLISVILTLTLGPLGGHRIYLGTNYKVPLIYAITLGGVFILPVIDLLHLIFSKDISRFQNNSKIFMWAENNGKKMSK